MLLGKNGEKKEFLKEVLRIEDKRGGESKISDRTGKKRDMLKDTNSKDIKVGFP